MTFIVFRHNYQEEGGKISTTLCRVMILCQNMCELSELKVTKHRVLHGKNTIPNKLNILVVTCKNKIWNIGSSE